MRFENTEVYNFSGAMRSMRMPYLSHNKSDSGYMPFETKYVIGDNDLDLATRLIKAGNEHCKFLRSIYVDTVITCPQYICAELDTYKINTVRNSSSLQHLGSKREFTRDDFTLEDDILDICQDDFQSYLDLINRTRAKYLETNDYKYFRFLRQLLPMGYNYTFSFSTNYAQLRNMYMQRKNHRLKEWNTDFVEWIVSLPYSQLITIESEK